ncbi:hypothetical protein [Mycobacterium heckeshornense]|uniref:Uncharacterized protein n=1 Tax=Mycobacterium heckeshornense TaxID=110505 RepID=A0A7R7GSZ5_9MYCO|nr:hypothetical protein [Mycobacterium heckeshornense]MCV7032859.1 hypothetical protein [Mycobacterium heckeshornense]BCO35503.1 hypothetical protein MHEC_19360 [Mycobacterium heckeshornense]
MPQRYSVLSATEKGDHKAALIALRRRISWQLSQTRDARAVAALVKTLLEVLERLRQIEGGSAASAPSVLAEVRRRRLERQRRASVRPVEGGPSDPVS